MTFQPSPLVKAYIFACKQARDRAELAAWIETQKPRMQANLPHAEVELAIGEARQHWRRIEVVR